MSRSSTTLALLGALTFVTACTTSHDVLQGGATAADRAAALAVVQEAFDAIEASDPDAWRAVLLDAGHFTSVRDTPDGRAVQARSFEEDLANTGRDDAHYLERWWDPIVLIDGDIATVWTSYDFFIDGQFSHCGTDVFVLLQTEDGWRIASIAWNVVRDCPPSPLGPPPDA